MILRTPRMAHWITGMVVVLTVMVAGRPARADDSQKLIVLPVSDSTNMSTGDINYLYNVMMEAASQALAGRISLIHEGKVRHATRQHKKSCKENCAISAAQKTGAGLALLFELGNHDGKTVGFLKLLDANTESVIAAKRFFTQQSNASAIEGNLQASIRYVLSANFLPMDPQSRQALMSLQRQLPPPRPISNEIPLQAGPAMPPSTVQGGPMDATPNAHPEPAPAPAPERRGPDPAKKGIYLGVGAATAVVAVGTIIAGAITAGQASDEKEKQDYWTLLQTEAGNSNNETAYWEYDQSRKDAEKAAQTNTGIAIGLLGVGTVAAVLSPIFFVKYAKAKKAPSLGRLRILPVASSSEGALVLTGSF